MHFRFLPFFGLSYSSRSKCGHKGEQQQLKMHCVRKEGEKIFWLFLLQAENYVFSTSKQSQHFCLHKNWTKSNKFLKRWDIGPAKVIQKFSLSIFGFSKSVLNLNLETQVLKPHKNRMF